LGKLFVRRLQDCLLIGRIVEVEAYRDRDDPASHSFNGRTQRNEIMFRTGGHLYVYFSYGMHYCANVVTEREGRGCAVLIRALEPLKGIDAMARVRGVASSDLRKVCSGPARVCQAFGIGRGDNGTDLCGASIWISAPEKTQQKMTIATSQRIGISHGKDRLWRFFLPDSPYLSR
jgi:DNA-3-methyladenine glycosylase